MKKKYMILGIAAVLAVLLIGTVIWAMPYIQSARVFHGVKDFGNFQYEVSIKPREANLSQEQRKLIEAVSWCLGAEDSQSWKAVGRVCDDKIYAEIYWEGVEDPVTEVYFSQEESLLNVKMLYETIQKNAVSAHPLVGKALPDWNAGTFLSQKQIEEIFQMDLEKILQINVILEDQKSSAWHSFSSLAKMDREKGEQGNPRFETERENYHISLEFEREEGIPTVRMKAADQAQKEEIAEYEGMVQFAEPEEIVFPEDLMREEEIERFSKFWSGFQELKNDTIPGLLQIFS